MALGDIKFVGIEDATLGELAVGLKERWRLAWKTTQTPKIPGLIDD